MAPRLAFVRFRTVRDLGAQVPGWRWRWSQEQLFKQYSRRMLDAARKPLPLPRTGGMIYFNRKRTP